MDKNKQKCPTCDIILIEADYDKRKSLLDADGCSCHINPPCWLCSSEVQYCKKCNFFEEQHY